MGCKVLITEDIDDEGKEYLRKYGYGIKMASDIDEKTLVKEVRDCDAILVRMASITENIINSAPKLKVISRFGVGFDNVDLKAAKKRGIQVTYGPESNKDSVAEYTMGLIVALAKRFFLYDRELKNGNFGIRNFLGSDVREKVLGIVGMGRIGNVVASMAYRGFKMKVIGFKRHIESGKMEGVQLTDNLDYLLSNSDFVSLSVPLNESTRHMIGRREISLMKPGAFLVNTARGEIVDESALVDALINGKIAGAAVDVFAGEIPSKDNPLLKLDNVIVTPHTAAHTREAIKRMSLHSAIGVHEVLSGREPSWPVPVEDN
ncbi:hydroxyacid dehydrogenase [Clostridium luticellarii]|jgi:D-3-phosphoglycerate dehydrogenase|uniref:D-3-phosphoglycerate dehydrogenase n=1 Tax=Clostridium luticellarii TaxID=1691940 RepID=A0A2T0BSJ8_9CLOT|nr:hydroxyacid dehydrogenase [Clostridium luticellarii]MCI1945773.1 hydroxyacid dehydrogenase [Clostridium luticellarii]MCI1968475.1 hydroxyacid dehydrogenase [Clostridium luticellarii]MCI1996003.1 hydroxyacid dehydrogenase [Clostridium luticellarii]MCI2039869.1 hydroxyacid dehydrogenase [Clostridium luticellarii]PRR86866.1 D-3-phosphoglycerate dehydrogenase [Clostridium luticellarii]